MRIFLYIIISTVVSSVLILVSLNIPVKYLNIGSENLGATVTTISTATNLADFPAIYNADTTSLNDSKLETSAIYGSTTLPQITTLANLVTVGTITSGTWQGSVIDVARQGTGSTSPTLNYVMLGNGSSGFKVVSGPGTSGQFLTSNGSGSAPTWQTSAIDTAISYVWTGPHTFSNLFSTNASSTNATTTNFHITSIASSLLKTDANGRVSAATGGTDFAKPQYNASSATNISANNGYASSTLLTIPAGTLTASSTIEVSAGATCNSSDNPSDCRFFLRDSTGATLASSGQIDNAAVNKDGNFSVHVFSNNSTSAQNGFMRMILGNTVAASIFEIVNSEQTSTVNFANELSLVLVSFSNSANTTALISNWTVEVDP